MLKELLPGCLSHKLTRFSNREVKVLPCYDTLLGQGNNMLAVSISMFFFCSVGRVISLSKDKT